jgi:hypothetical protein
MKIVRHQNNILFLVGNKMVNIDLTSNFTIEINERYVVINGVNFYCGSTYDAKDQFVEITNLVNESILKDSSFKIKD